MRVKNGLVALQKCHIGEGKNTPIEHNVTAHGEFRGRVSGKTNCALSLTQNMHVARHFKPDGIPDIFIKEMFEQPCLAFSPSQFVNPEAFKNSIRNFYDHNPRLCCGGKAKKKPMTADLLLEVLQLLGTSPDQRNHEDDAPCGESRDEYYGSNIWKNYLWKYIHVYSHNYDHISDSSNKPSW